MHTTYLPCPTYPNNTDYLPLPYLIPTPTPTYISICRLLSLVEKHVLVILGDFCNLSLDLKQYVIKSSTRHQRTVCVEERGGESVEAPPIPSIYNEKGYPPPHPSLQYIS